MKYFYDKIESLAKTNMEDLVFNSELSFNSQVSFIAEKIYDNEDCKLVLVVGPSSSGKTTFTKILANRLEYLGIKAHTLSTDDYFIDREKLPILPSGLKDFDSINAVDVTALKKSIDGILNGDWVEIPAYDFKTGKSTPKDKLIKLHQEDVVILEGIHSFNPVLLDDPFDQRVLRVSIMPRSEFVFDDFTLYPDDLRLLRRSIRDLNLRGHTFDATIRQWKEVLSAEETYIKPYLHRADYRVDSVYAYELFIYKHCIYEALKNHAPKGYEVILKTLERIPYLPIPTIPLESVLNEFVHFIKE